jgi:hypothetical protein
MTPTSLFYLIVTKFVISSNLEIISRVYPKLVESIPTFNNHIRLEHDSNLYWGNDFRKRFWQSVY